MTVHLLGGAWSPSCASFALRHTATDNQDTDSTKAVQMVKDNFYVDDMLSSVDDTMTAARVVHDLCALLSQGGFNLRGWASNKADVLLEIEPHKRIHVLLKDPVFTR